MYVVYPLFVLIHSYNRLHNCTTRNFGKICGTRWLLWRLDFTKFGSFDTESHWTTPAAKSWRLPWFLLSVSNSGNSILSFERVT